MNSHSLRRDVPGTTGTNAGCTRRRRVGLNLPFGITSAGDLPPRAAVRTVRP